MMRVARFCVVLLLLFGSAAPRAQAQAQAAYEMTPRQREIIQIIMNAQGGYIDAALYDEYWSAIAFTPEEKQWVVKEMRAFMFNGQNFSRESWASAAVALKTGRYTETEAYQRAKQDSLEALRAIPGATTDEFERSIENAERIIRAAAQREPMDFGGGRVAYITEELIETVTAGIDGSLDRVDLLLQPEWRLVEKELVLKEPGLKALLPWRPSRSVAVQQMEQGFEVPITSYLAALDATTFVNIGFADYGAVDAPPDYRKAMFAGARAGFKSTGLALSGEPVVEKWRGRDTVVAWATGTAEGGPFAGYIRIYRPGKRKGLTMITLMREGSMGDLVPLVEAFEHKINPLQ